MLRRTGFREAAEEAMRELPDPVDVEHLVAWGSRHGITRELLISQMGGSPMTPVFIRVVRLAARKAQVS
jgi:hypothetical protein